MKNIIMKKFLLISACILITMSLFGCASMPTSTIPEDMPHFLRPFVREVCTYIKQQRTEELDYTWLFDKIHQEINNPVYERQILECIYQHVTEEMNRCQIELQSSRRWSCIVALLGIIATAVSYTLFHQPYIEEICNSTVSLNNLGILVTEMTKFSSINHKEITIGGRGMRTLSILEKDQAESTLTRLVKARQKFEEVKWITPIVGMGSLCFVFGPLRDAQRNYDKYKHAHTMIQKRLISFSDARIFTVTS